MMFTLQTLIIFLTLASAFPVGYLLAYLCRDELKAGRKWFRIIAWASLALILMAVITYRDFSMILTLAYICIVALISVEQSHKEKSHKNLENKKSRK